MSTDDRETSDVIAIEPFQSFAGESALKDTYEQLEDYVRARRPLIYICDYDFATIDRMVKAIANEYKMDVSEFVEGVGPLEGFDAKTPVDTEASLTAFLLNRLEEIERQECDKILLLKNIHSELQGRGEGGSPVASILRQIAGRSQQDYGKGQREYYLCVIMVSTERVIPPELEQLMCFLTLGKPSQREIFSHLEANLPDEQEEALRNAALELYGLSFLEIDQIVNMMISLPRNGDSVLDSKTAKKIIQQEKKQLVEKSGLLKMIAPGEEQIGGLENLKEHIKGAKGIYENLLEAKEAGVPIPKGILIVGVPGCGKSLAAKYTAREFERPLLCLDIGKLMGPYVGQSEANMRRALEVVAATAPCVLWIDEIEKAFAGVGTEGTVGGSEVTTRLFGSFLTWMQEKQDDVYVVATANHIEKLPTELKRRGRFDEIFWVGLPGSEEREEIFRVKLARCRKLQKGIDYKKLADSKNGFSGSDIEAIVGNVVKKAFLRKEDVITQKMLEAEIDATVPLSAKLEREMQFFEEQRKVYHFTPASK